MGTQKRTGTIGIVDDLPLVLKPWRDVKITGRKTMKFPALRDTASENASAPPRL